MAVAAIVDALPAGGGGVAHANPVAQAGSSVDIAAMGPNGSLDFYFQPIGASGWH